MPRERSVEVREDQRELHSHEHEEAKRGEHDGEKKRAKSTTEKRAIKEKRDHHKNAQGPGIWTGAAPSLTSLAPEKPKRSAPEPEGSPKSTSSAPKSKVRARILSRAARG